MATDGSQRGVAALAAAGRMLSTVNREIDLMCVVPKVPAHKMHPDRLYRRAQHILDKTQKSFCAAGLAVRTKISTGSAARIILGASYNYDVTVVASTSRRSGPMAGLGPVASRLAEHSRRVTLLARESRGETGCRILVAVDGSEGSLQALSKMVETIELTDAEVTLVHVVETPWVPGPDQEWLGYHEDEEDGIEGQPHLQDEFVREADGILATACERIPEHTELKTLIYEGIPADEILGEADRGDYDLVVIGASGVTDLKHQVLGSVSSKVAWNAPCSVSLVRPES